MHPLRRLARCPNFKIRPEHTRKHRTLIYSQRPLPTRYPHLSPCFEPPLYLDEPVPPSFRKSQTFVKSCRPRGSITISTRQDLRPGVFKPTFSILLAVYTGFFGADRGTFQPWRPTLHDLHFTGSLSAAIMPRAMFPLRRTALLAENKPLVCGSRGSRWPTALYTTTQP